MESINKRIMADINFQLRINHFEPAFKEKIEEKVNPEMDSLVSKRFEKLKQERNGK